MSDFDISGVLRIDTSDLDRVTGRVGNTAKNIGAALAGAFAVNKMVEWGKAGLIAAGQYERTQVAFTSMLGSAEKARGFMGQLEEFSLGTPFDFPGIAEASQKLLGYGFAAESVIPTMQSIGDVASLLNVTEAGMNGFVRSIGQMRGKGKVSADEIRQISENFPGFNAAASIAASKGISVAETYKLMEKGAIPAEEGISAILQAMKNYPGAAGAMDRANKSFLGSLTQLKETVRLAATKVFMPYLPYLAKAMRSLSVVLLKTIVPASIAASNAFIAFARDAITSLQPVARFLGDVFGVVLERVQGTLSNFADVASEAWGRFSRAFQTPGITQGVDVIDDRLSQFGALMGVTFREASAYVEDFLERFINGFRNPGVTEGMDAIDDRVTLFGARIQGLLAAVRRQFELFGMGIRGSVTLDDTKPMYQLGEAVAEMGRTIDDHGPLVIKFWKDELLPILERVGIFISDNIIPILGGLSAAFTALRIIGVVTAIAGAISAIGAVIGPVVAAVSSLGGIIGLLGGPVTIAVVAIGALVAGVIYAYKHFEGFREFVGRMTTYISEQFNNLVAFGKEIWPQLSEAIGHVMNVIGDVIGVVLVVVTELWRLFGDDIMRIVKGAFEIIKSVVETVINTVANVIRLVLAVINGDWDKAWTALLNIVKGIWNGLVGIVKGGLEIVIGVLGGAYELIKTAVKGSFDAITDTLQAVLKGMAALGRGIMTGLIEGLKSEVGQLKTEWNKIIQILPGDFANGLMIRSPSRLFRNLGKQIPAGVALGIRDGAGLVDSAMTSMLPVPELSGGAAMAGVGAASGGSSIVIGDIIINGVTDPAAMRGVMPELVDALRAAVGAR